MTRHDTPGGFPVYLAALMERDGLRPTDLADRAGFDASLISRWKKGHQPDVPALRKISAATDVPLLHLLVAAGHISQEEADITDQAIEEAVMAREPPFPAVEQLTERQRAAVEAVIAAMVDPGGAPPQIAEDFQKVRTLRADNSQHAVKKT